MPTIGQRVRAAMRERGMTQKALAEHAHMTPDSMSRALRGERGFAAIELADIARTLGADVHFLITGEADPSRLVLAARHDFDHVTKVRSADGIEDDHDTLTKIHIAYEQAGTLKPTPALPDNPVEVRESLGADFVRTFAQRLEHIGVDVLILSELSTAYSLTIKNRKVIAVNSSGNWFHENWSIAHELGHHALGHQDVRPDHPQVHTLESQANSFAAELLLPEEVMRSKKWSTMSCADLANLLWSWGVSTGALNARLSTLNIEPAPEVSKALEGTTQGVLRRFWGNKNDPHGSDDITDRMAAANQRHFPTWLRSAHLERVEAGKLHYGALEWILGTTDMELDIPGPGPAEHLEGDELLALLR